MPRLRLPRRLTVGGALATLAAAAAPLAAQRTAHGLIIDVHLHAVGAADQGPPGTRVCPGVGTLPAPPMRVDSASIPALMRCSVPLVGAMTDDELMRRTIAIMVRHDVRGVLSGDRARVRRWMAAAPGRFLAGTTGDDPPDSVRAWVRAGTLDVIGELGFQYAGLAPGDSLPARWLALADSLDVPVAIHMGPGPPGAAYIAAPRYRMALSDPLLLEETLVRHPGLRLYVMHAGWPMLDRTVALLWAHPQVYVDLGVISWAIPKAEFHAYLRRLVAAGFGERILFGSDQMTWPDALAVAIERIESASFLTAAQKRAIFHDNAVRFLRLGATGWPRR